MESAGTVQVLRQSSEGVFVPLTVGGGIRDLKDASGHSYTALEVAGEYFRSGADKVGLSRLRWFLCPVFILICFLRIPISDRNRTLVCYYSRRNAWHTAGVHWERCSGGGNGASREWYKDWQDIY